MRKKFLGQLVMLNIDVSIKKVRIIDVEFDSGVGPVFLLKSPYGSTFWLTRKELKEYEVTNKMVTHI